MKRFTQFICVILAFSILGSVPISAEEVSPFASAYFLSYDSYIRKTSDTTIQIWFDVSACVWMDELGVSTIEVQRSSDCANWTTMRTYHSSTYPKMMCEDTGSHVGYVSYSGTAGYYYRAYVTFYAKNSNGSAVRFDYAETILL